MSRRLPLVATLLAVLLLALAPSGAGAVMPDEMLANPVLEKRARDISKQLRCLVCQNESIDQSDADLAHDLRVLVRDRLKAGDTNKQVIDYIVSRYGDFVLLDPPIELRTYILWYGTPAIGLLGLLAAALYFRRNRRPAVADGAAGDGEADALQPPPLSDEEQARVRRLLERAGDDDNGDDKGTPS